MNDTITETIARVAHEVNRAYCQSIGDDSQLPWFSAPQWQKDSAIHGVELHINNPNAGPEASHEAWMAEKESDGWVYGDVKNPEKKTHPCMIPFDRLPLQQQSKGFIFRAVVHAVAIAIASTQTKSGLKSYQEPKYTTDGCNIINRASGEPIPSDEPIIIFRAKDIKALDALRAYRDMCDDSLHRNVVQGRIAAFEDFRDSHPDAMSEPDSDKSCLQ